MHEFGSEFRELIELSLGPPGFDPDVAAIDVAELTESDEEAFDIIY
jgi:hypothetical protein